MSRAGNTNQLGSFAKEREMAETIKVSTDAFEGGFMVISKQDFDAETMVEFGAIVEDSKEKSLKKSK